MPMRRMPTARRRVYRRKRSMRATRRVYRRRRVARPVKLSLTNGFPRKLIDKLRYCDAYNITINTSGGPLTGIWSQVLQTSLYDPDLTLTGHQPMYFDQLAAIYAKYRVYGIGYHITFCNTNTSQLMPVVILHTPNSSVVSTSNWNLIEEQTGSRKVVIGPSSSKPTVVKGYISIARTLGISGVDVRTDPNFEAAINSNPARMAFLHLYASSLNTSAGNIMNVNMRLTYYCEFSNLAQSSQS